MLSFMIKKGSLWPPFQVQINLNKTSNLTGGTAALHIRDTGGVLRLSVPLTITDGAAGEANYQWITGDTDSNLTTGTYWGEVWVTAADGTLVKLPDDGYINFTIMSDVE